MLMKKCTYSEDAKVVAALRVDCATLQKRLALSRTASFQGARCGSHEGDKGQGGEDGGFDEFHC